MPDDFLRIASALAPGAAVPRGVRRAPWAAVAVRTQRRGRGRAGARRTDGSRRRQRRRRSSRRRCTTRWPRTLGPAATEAEESLSSGVNLLGLDAIKGLEFDAAVVLEPRLILDERPGGGVGGLYTALTRSTRALAVVHAEPLPDVLADAEDLRPVPEAGAAEALGGRPPLRRRGRSPRRRLCVS